MTYHEIRTVQFHEKLVEIQQLLSEAYEHYFAESDGCCKSSEGAIEINLPPFFWRYEDNEALRPGVGIYSYVLGPSRMHYFDNIDEALAAVKVWHQSEMTQTYEDDWNATATEDFFGWLDAVNEP